MKLLKSIALLIAAVIGLSLRAHAQEPCLSGWNYRVPVTLTNTGATTLTDYQALVTVNTSDLIVNGKMQISGGDIRFLNSAEEVLPHWIEDGTVNTTATRIWVKVDELLGSATKDIYMFYGSPSAPNLSSGDNTFELFDGFDDIAVNPNKWNVCGDGSAVVSNGRLTLSSSATADEKLFIVADQAVVSPVIIESDVISVDNGQTIIGLIDGSDNGFGINYEVDGQPSILMREINSDGGGCYQLDDVQDPANQDALSANVTQGTWAFAWYPGNSQYFDWPGNGDPSPLIRNEDEHTTPGTYFPFIGHINQGDLNGPATTATGDITINWTRVRKYTASEPAFALGSETVIINEVTASGTEVVCEGQTIELFAEALPGAVFSWSGPNGFTSTDQNPTISSATLAAAGTYTVTATVPTNCFTVEDDITVSIDAATVAGTLTGASTVCTGSNSGSITLADQTGDIVRWESSPTGEVPWATINNTTASLDYLNLLNTTHYRAIVQSGSCDPTATNVIEITVDQTVVPGNVLGAAIGCIGENEGVLRMNDFTGNVARWESKAESSSVWEVINTTRDTLVYENLTETTQFRAVIELGTCGEAPSAPATITIVPLPQPQFQALSVCKGNTTAFTNLSSISTGTIESYLWDLDDGSSSVLPAPSHEYESAATFDVSLTATSDQGCENSITRQIVVYPLPVVDFFVEDHCQRTSVEIVPNVSIATGSVILYDWEFGDGEDERFTDDDDFQYRYDTAGTYEILLEATSEFGCTSRDSADVIVFPRAVLSYEAASVFEGDQTTFFNNSTIESGNLTYRWAFGDGGSSLGINPSHTYPQSDTFSVQLISTSSFGGCKDTIRQEYIVKPQVFADFRVDDVCKDYPAVFSNLSGVKEGSLTYLWDFGDGNMSTEEEPTHLYDLPGEYRVQLEVTSEQDSKDVKERTLIVFPEPVADFFAEPECDQDTVNFKNLSTVLRGELTYQWDFDDGSTSTLNSPDHVFPTDGLYDVMLVVQTNRGCIDTTSITIEVYPLPQVAFSVDTVCHENTSIFINETSITSGSINEILWDFGDGTNSIVNEPQKDYANPGTYEAGLKATSNQGCVSSTSSIAHVAHLPVSAFEVANVCFGEPSIFVNTSTSQEGELSYRWNFGDESTDITKEPEHTYLQPDVYSPSLEVFTTLGCVDQSSLATEVYSLPSLVTSGDTTVSRGFPAPLEVMGAADYFWEPGVGLDFQNSPVPTATLLESQQYRIFGVDDNGCESETSLAVTVINDFIIKPANVITPDGNLINDSWYVENIESYENAQVTVFNLWGEVIFTTIGYRNDWEGTFQTDVLPEGNYYYKVTSPDHEKVYKGTLTLMRAR